MFCERNLFAIAGLLLVAIVGILADCPIADNIVQISNGCLEGVAHKDYLSFEGIRYAEPPLGENRFEPPKPYSEMWEGVRNATQLGSMCWQVNVLHENKLEGDEDCLFLNVYKPVADSSEEDKRLPVLVHIHGGGFMFGDGGFYGHELIMKEGKFIYVSINYRLGALGFLSTNCHLVPGNMGFKDQVLALKWVQQNIAAFGGDPDSVTISGFSAGGASVHLHYISPLSKDLFHRGISHSGCALNEWVMMENPLERAVKLAENLECPTDSHKEMIKCLKTKDAKTLIPHPIFFSGVKEYEHDNAFITDHPHNYLKEGRIHKLPWLASGTKDDGAFMMAKDFSNASYWEELNHHPEKWFLHMSGAVTPEIGEKLRQHYFNGELLTIKNAAIVGKIVTDRGFFYGITESILLQGKLAPVYFYLYKFKLSRGLTFLMTKDENDLGVVHGDDVLLIHSTPAHSGDFKYTKDEKDMTEELLEMYESFSKDEVPKFDDIPLTRATDKLEYTDILGPKTAAFGQTEQLCDMEFWREIKRDLKEIY